MALVYVSGPYENQDDDLKKTIIMAELLVEKGFSIFVPHGQPSKLNILERCDVLFRFNDESEDGTIEEKIAKERGIPIFNDYRVMMAFFREGSE